MIVDKNKKSNKSMIYWILFRFETLKLRWAVLESNQ